MGRENNEPTALHSIALLQERFRQLQRIKEMREEREQQRLFTKSERPSPSAQCEQPTWFCHPDLVPPSRPLHGASSSHLHNHGGHTEFQTLETSLSIGLWPNKINARDAIFNNEAEVDTSLHL